MGKIVKNSPLSVSPSKTYFDQIDIAHFADGVYFLFVKNNHSFIRNKTFIKDGK